VGTVGPVVHIGARPVLIDSEPTSWNLSPALLAEELTERRRANRLPAAVIAVDLYGRCADYDEITRLCAEVEVPLIEDAAEALGATRNGRPAGSFGEMAVLSFNGNKIITSSGGGALVCDDPHTAERARYLATQARQPEVHYEHTEIGFNYRLSNLLAAFGHGQLDTLDERIQRRREIRSRYTEALADVPGVEVAPTGKGNEDNAWLTCILVDPDQCPQSPEDLRLALEAEDIESRPLWKPMHLQPALSKAAARLDGTSERLFEQGLCLPSGSAMSDGGLERVIGLLTKALGLPSA
jgi:dTDP-4-amino-4,6-dideoxygalactose transaminase